MKEEDNHIEVSLAPEDRIKELGEFYRDLCDYGVVVKRALDRQPTKASEKQRTELVASLGRRANYIGRLITELTGLSTIDLSGKEYDMWVVALEIPPNKIAYSAILYCIQVTNRAIGQLIDDIRNGVRDKKGNLIDKSRKVNIEPLKAFIAHEGETRALTMLKEFLEALGIQYFIAELKASSGRSVERQVDWTQSKADFAICLATKGKAINKKTGKHYMALNVADELGRARQVFRNKIILLLQKGVEPHSNVREIVHEHFTTTNMDKAFIKIVKELINWGFLRVGKEEQT